MVRFFSTLLVAMGLFVPIKSQALNEFLSIEFSDEVNGEPQTSFYCNEQIYAHVIIRDITQDEIHDIRIVWRDPTSTDQEVIEKRLLADSSGQIVQYIWLKLHRPRGSSFISLFDDSYGMTDFIGKWHLVVYVDDEEQSSAPFEVHC